MGGTVSCNRPSQEMSILLEKLSSTESISPNDPFWNKLLNFEYQVDECLTEKVHQFIDYIKEPCSKLFKNCEKSGNIGTLIKVFLRRANNLYDMDLSSDKYYLLLTSNCLLIIRHIFGYFINETTDILLHEIINFDDYNKEEKYESDFCDDINYSNLSDELISNLINILIKVPYFLAQNYLHQIKKNARRAHETESGGSYVLSIGYSLFKSVKNTFLENSDGIDSSNDPFSSSDIEDKEISLSSLSCNLLLYLVCRNNNIFCNSPFLNALEKFGNAQEISNNDFNNVIFTIDYTHLYNHLCKYVHKQSVMLLFYMLIHKNEGFKNFILSRINLENLVVPVLKVLNGADYENKRLLFENNLDEVSTHSVDEPISVLRKSHHIYLSLINILILTEDDFFGKIIHETIIKDINWYLPSKHIREISLGGLIALVIMKVIHMNTIKTRDRYLHTNCLAALANISSNFKNLDPYVCHKLTSLLILMMKKHVRLIQNIRNIEDEVGEKAGDDCDNSSIYHYDIIALEEGIRTILEMINSCLCNNLRSNPHLIYYMLYRREIFDSFRDHPMFQDLSDNVFAVINHFSLKLGNINDKSVEDILSGIEEHSLTWPTDRLKKFPELKFKYVEDENTAEFFVPYIWRLIASYSGIYYKNSSIQLYNALQ
ncbi:Dymeclin [Strongyloides ratti]|uniref:Dymeclin n=1 Tax=Strongyloides ratti TaxID=34506 RepID=A0A090KX03_STRRB|nr:Dymeclin [Strongyloides ratti]CEF60402.1 Dymeclin [Strongyloides ratti]